MWELGALCTRRYRHIHIVVALRPCDADDAFLHTFIHAESQKHSTHTAAREINQPAAEAPAHQQQAVTHSNTRWKHTIHHHVKLATQLTFSFSQQQQPNITRRIERKRATNDRLIRHICECLWNRRTALERCNSNGKNQQPHKHAIYSTMYYYVCTRRRLVCAFEFVCGLVAALSSSSSL